LNCTKKVGGGVPLPSNNSHIFALLFACIFFAYATVNSLIFYSRARRDREYSNKTLNDFAKSPRYAQTVWISGIIGAIGFTIASWRLLLALWSRY
jgi:hypothetical protein